MSPAAGSAAPPELLDRLRADGVALVDGDRGPEAKTGDLEAELHAARRTAAVYWDPRRSAVLVSGEDRASFLQRMLTQGVLDASDGDVRRSLLLDNKGRIVADLDLGFAADRVLGLGAAAALDDTIETLQRYILRAAVHLEGLAPTHVVLRLVGPDAESVLSAVIGGSVPDSGLTSTRWNQARLWCCRSSRALPTGFELLVAGESAADLWGALRDVGEGSGARAMGRQAAEVLRVEAGVPRHGAEITGSEFPQEVRLDAAVDFDKGCYLGQETVARIRYRGKVNRVLTGLESTAPLQRSASVRAADREIGTITSAVRRGTDDWLALGYVRTEHAEPGAGLSVDSADATASVARVRDMAWWGAPPSPGSNSAPAS